MKYFTTLRNTAALSLLFIISFFSFASECSAQMDSAPPPLATIPQEIRRQLAGETEVKNRTKLAIELMEIRIASAEQLATENKYELMYTELGVFQGILDDTLGFLGRNDDDSRRSLYNFKRFELGLRSFLPRIATIRRELPFRYEAYVKQLVNYVRDARRRSLEPLFDDSVVRVPRVS